MLRAWDSVHGGRYKTPLRCFRRSYNTTAPRNRRYASAVLYIRKTIGFVRVAVVDRGPAGRSYGVSGCDTALTRRGGFCRRRSSRRGHT